MLTVLNGDCRDVLADLPDESVHCCVTSPPYWGLRDYGVGGQLGLEPTPEQYVATMVEVFREVRRVLRSDGTLWMNLGDSYAGGGTIGRNDTSPEALSRRAERYGTGQGNGSLVGSQGNRPQVAGLKPKDLCGIPWMLAFALRADGAASPAHMRDIERMIAAVTASYDTRDEWPDRIAAEVERLEAEHIDANRGGWYLRSEIIWAKPNPMPESVTDRPTKAHEQVFLMAKSARYFYDAEAIREQFADERMGNPGPSKAGDNPDRNDGGIANNGNGWARGAQMSGRNRRTVWTIPTAPYSEAHFATFPPKLVEPCVLAGTSARGCCAACGAPWERVVERGDLVPDSPEYKPRGNVRGGDGFVKNAMTPAGEMQGHPNHHYEYQTTGWQPTCVHLDADVVPCSVLDPFAGSGTVGQVALELGRRAVLIELNPKYCEMIERRNQVTLGLPGLA